MGLLDSILSGGPANQSGISAATKALLLVMAAKAAKDYVTKHQQAASPSSGAAPAGGLGGMLGGLLGGGQSGGLGSLTQGGGLGGVLAGLGGAGGLGSLVDLFRQNGHGNAIGSWIANGPNQQMQPAQLGQALGPNVLQELEQHTGLPQQSLLEELAHQLPSAIDHVTPEGRLPTEGELAATVAPVQQPS